MPIRAVLFDFDGTLADSYPAIAASVNYVRAQAGLTPMTVAEVRPMVGHGLPHLLQQVAPNMDTALGISLYRQHHRTIFRELTRLFPDTLSTLACLHEHGIRLGICSNKLASFTRPLVEALGLADFITVVLGPEDVPLPKPAPDMLQAALHLLAVAADDTIYVGDMSVDIQTARAAGVRVWVVPTGSETLAQLKRGMPDRTLSSLAQLRELVLEA